MSARDLRIALLAGTLGTGGAEKQLVYAARGLLEEGASVRLYCLTRGESHEASFRSLGLVPEWVGQWGNPLFRVAALARRLARFRPHIVHSSHFYANMHVALAGALSGTMSVGTVRSDGVRELGFHRLLGRAMLSWPDGLIVNSTAAFENVVRLRGHADRVCFVPNVLDVEEFDRQAGLGLAGDAWPQERPCAVIVGRLIRAKRVDRFLRALAIACRAEPVLRGLVVGDGPERAQLEALAGELGLGKCVRFLGARHDVPAVLGRADMLVLTSDQEGFPNVLLEAMAARLPVVTTPAGDAACVVRDKTTGEVVAFEDLDGLAQAMVGMARSGAVRSRLGLAGRAVVESEYGSEGCGARLADAYRRLAAASGRTGLADAIAA